uniref:RWD domain-containing protein n=1 Tax=Palpitomonas bilix TaxID=652834 RepID=A0A7S3G1F1_9EUKA|mmetsp:Transcript_10682/g.27989  ORF Transcript_10682/g.27989 Transcript_10682/m.27989 type:complete len:260 (+) Transcript_10682:220-999(+)|eukprot:CAMPEP_0113873122 /NCGR_PEP_ID=MMETSP0780_2-20120614/3592_1 /TAXON_ID=652834 /ORGANISM="Palpitomonas bilix" /LENGTH=259 /DNA_ID=CAMNT_0000858727 /DNA_START=110 /DNA_END=889 /DNA_ORIENTATION=+ /assembly_acc=CAM_ASM_000599
MPRLSADAVDEMEALSTIFTERYEQTTENSAEIEIEAESDGDIAGRLSIIWPEGYPDEKAPLLSFTPADGYALDFDFQLHVQTAWAEMNACIVFDIVATLSSSVHKRVRGGQRSGGETNHTQAVNVSHELLSTPLDIVIGEVTVDRKSRFQSRGVELSSFEQLQAFRHQILQDKKVAQATHNILAYRFQKDGKVMEDFDDDGEGGAGIKLLFLLQKMGAMNCAVVVSRWFGGIKLGGDRFRDINESAKALVTAQKWGKN